MGYKQCMYSNGHCYSIVEQCNGCDHIQYFNEIGYCNKNFNPWSMWINQCRDSTVLMAKEIEKKNKYIENLKRKQGMKKNRKRQKKK